jgi:hypothetical protein
MDDIMTAVDNDLSFDEFLEWYDYCLIVGRGSPNLRSWADGCPRLSAEDLDKIEEARRLIRELEDGIGELVKNDKK